MHEDPESQTANSIKQINNLFPKSEALSRKVSRLKLQLLPYLPHLAVRIAQAYSSMKRKMST